MAHNLNALDMAFLALETQKTPVNVASLQLLEIPPGYKGNFVRDLLQRLRKRHPGPPFNLKLSRSSLTGVPRWVEDEHFDLDYHVRHSALPAPGEDHDLLDLVSRLHSRVLDRERPLWEFHLIEGLSDGRFAMYTKMHHAAIDGMGGIAVLEACCNEKPDTPLRAPWEGVPKKAPTRGGQRRRHSLLGNLLRGASNQVHIAPDIAKLLAGHGMKALGIQAEHSPALFSAPRSYFNGAISGARLFAIKTVSLSDIKALAKTANATVNDIVLAICSGALRNYLSEKQALPEKSLIASVPVSIRQIKRSGNQISYISADLATDRSRPLDRLQAIRHSTQLAKDEIKGISPHAATTFAVLAQGLVAVLNRFQLASLLPPPANVIISNVPGPAKPLYFGGAKMVANYPLSVLVDGQALNITVVSYVDSVDFGLMACRDTLPDVGRLADYMGVAFEELRTAAAREAKRSARKDARKAGSNGAAAPAAEQPSPPSGAVKTAPATARKASAGRRKSSRKKTARATRKKDATADSKAAASDSKRGERAGAGSD